MHYQNWQERRLSAVSVTDIIVIQFYVSDCELYDCQSLQGLAVVLESLYC